MSSSNNVAIAVDLGTTTIAASLLDMATGRRLADAGALNPQREFGSDVILRLQAACESESNLRKMAQLVNEKTERLARDLIYRAGVTSEYLSTIAIAGNPAMEHLLLSLPVDSLAYPPYRPSFRQGQVLNTSHLGWTIDRKIHVFPLPAGFVGGDLVAFLYSSLVTTPSCCLFLDLGTNAEIALVKNGTIMATSAAAGPAFEGGNLACGMAALEGAITRVEISHDRVSCAVIGGGPPSGICGSGVIDAVCGLLKAGVVDATGRLLPAEEISTNLGNRITEIDGESAFVIYKDAGSLVYLSQKDIREVQVAKAAIRAGVEVLLTRAGIGADDVQKVVLTGSFGCQLSAEALKSIGILTGKMVHNTDFIHEGVLAGVEKALKTPNGIYEVDNLAKMISVIPLSGTPMFEKLFIKHMNFPER